MEGFQMKKTKLTSVMVAAAFALSATACSKRAADPSEAVETTAQSVTDTTGVEVTSSETTAEEASTVAGTEASAEASTEAGTEGSTAEPASANSTEEATEAAIEYPTLDLNEVVVPLDSIDVAEYIDLSKVNSMVIRSDEVKVNEASIKYNIAYYLQQEFGFTLEEVDRPVEGGDTVIIDYAGSVDGELFDGGSDTNYELGIGSESFIPGFEDGIIGKKTGDEFDLPVTFPEDYRATHLAGKDAVFHVTVNGVKALQEVTDDMIREKSEGKYETLKAYQDEIENEMREYHQSSYIFDNMMANVIEKKQHEGLINEYVLQQYNRIDQICAAYGMDRSLYYSAAGYTEAEIDNMLKENGADYAKQKLMILGICRQEGYEIEDSELAKLKQELIEEYELGDEETLLSYMTEDDIKYQLYYEKFRDYIKNYKIED